MPYAPLRQCTKPGCPNLVPKGRCPAHRLEVDQARGTPSARGYDHAWTKLRAQVLRDEPDCQACGAEGQPSDHVDHIRPLSAGGTNERENLQRLCHRCHSVKTATEGGFGR